MAGEQLLVSEGNARDARLAVDGELLVGRAAAVEDGRLGDDPEISRRHARLVRGASGELTVEDLGSSNGTFVNGERLNALRTLQVGDVVRMGKTVLHVTDASGRVPEPTQLGAAPATELSAAVSAELLVKEGAAEGRVITLDDELVIGRAESGEGRLGNDPELSRRHARVFRDGQGRLERRGSGVRQRHVREWRAHQRAPAASGGRPGTPRPDDPGADRDGRGGSTGDAGARLAGAQSCPGRPLPPRPRRRARLRRRPPRRRPVLPRRPLPPRPRRTARLRRRLPYPRRRLRPPLQSRRKGRPRHDRRRPHPPTRSRSAPSLRDAGSTRSSGSATWGSCTGRRSLRSSGGWP